MVGSTATPPSRGPAIVGWVSLGLVALAALLCAVRLAYIVQDTASVLRVLGNPARLVDPQVPGPLEVLPTLALLGCLGLGRLLFARAVRTASRGLGVDPYLLLRHWTLAVWRAGLLVMLLLTVVGPGAGGLVADTAEAVDLARRTGAFDETVLAVRLLVLAALAVTVPLARGRVVALLRAAEAARTAGQAGLPLAGRHL